MRGLIVGLVGVVWAAAVPLHAATVYSVTDLGDLPGGEDKSRGTAINATGQVAGDSGAAGGIRAFLWQNEVMTDLGVLAQGHTWSVAQDINDSGQVVGSSRIDDSYSSQRPFIYSDGTMTNLGSFGGDYGFAMGINNAEQVVGLSRYPNGLTQAFRWSNGTMDDLGSLDGHYSCAYAINDAGQIVGVSTLNGDDRGFLWEMGTMSDLGDLPTGPDKTRAYDINNLGQVVGESAVASSPVGHAFVWQNGAMTDLGVLPNGNDSSFALSINHDGLVVGMSYGTTPSRAFLWDSVNGIQDLNGMLDSSGADWTLGAAVDINNSGQIVGWGHLNGLTRGFLLTVIPEPPTLALLGMGAIGLLVFTWRRRGSMKRFASCLAALFVLALAAGAAQAYVNIETVPVGNPGNAGEQSRNDAAHGWDETYYGGVSYTYNIGKYEVTAGQYRDFLNAVAASDPNGLYDPDMWSHTYGCKIEQSGSPGSYTYSIPDPLRVNRPVNYVSWYNTLRFANWLHNGQPSGIQDASTTEDGAYDMSLGDSVVRKPGALVFLTSEDEWYKAAYHKNDGDTANYFDYPTSSDSTPGRDMTEATNSGNNANYYGIPYPIDSPYYTTVAGEFENSQSPYGTFDQGGNLREWNETDIYGEGTLRCLRGGSYRLGDDDRLLASYRTWGPPIHEYKRVGFRVASVPEPGSITLLAMGALVLLGYAWRRRRRR